MMVIAMATKKASNSSGIMPSAVVEGRHRDRPQAADAGIDDGRHQVLALAALQVDLVDQHDGVLDQHAHQAEETEQRHEAERLVGREQSHRDTDEGQRHHQPDDQRLAQRVEQHDGDQDHDQHERRDARRQPGLGVAGILVLPAPLQFIAGGQLDGLDLRPDTGKQLAGRIRNRDRQTP